jgi:hypothetical protein
MIGFNHGFPHFETRSFMVFHDGESHGFFILAFPCCIMFSIWIHMDSCSITELGWPSSYWCVLRKEWMGCWGLLGILIVSQWIIPENSLLSHDYHLPLSTSKPITMKTMIPNNHEVSHGFSSTTAIARHGQHQNSASGICKCPEAPRWSCASSV